MGGVGGQDVLASAGTDLCKAPALCAQHTHQATATLLLFSTPLIHSHTPPRTNPASSARRYACPKFVAAAAPDYGTPGANTNMEAFRAQLR